MSDATLLHPRAREEIAGIWFFLEPGYIPTIRLQVDGVWVDKPTCEHAPTFLIRKAKVSDMQHAGTWLSFIIDGQFRNVECGSEAKAMWLHAWCLERLCRFGP